MKPLFYNNEVLIPGLGVSLEAHRITAESRTGAWSGAQTGELLDRGAFPAVGGNQPDFDR